MERGVLVCCILLAQCACSFPHISHESEDTVTFSWLDTNWLHDSNPPDQLIRDKDSGCICRYQLRSYMVCYGGLKCSKFPQNLVLPPEIVDFRVKTTAITEVSHQDLQLFSNLEVLFIEANNHLSTIQPLAFFAMSQLKNLSISYNSKLKTLHPDTFVGLGNLEVLRLVKNGFEKVVDVSQALRTSYLPKLVKLSLSENFFSEITDYSFSNLNGTNITELDLVLCQIQKMSLHSLNVFRQLRTLRFGDNLVSEEDLGLVFKEMSARDLSINLLNLYNSGFRKDEKLTDLLSAISILNATHVILSRNHIESISGDLFPVMTHLRILDLREVSALYIDSQALNHELLPNLRVLLLAGNKLSGILPGVLVPQLKVLDLSENSGGAQSPSYFDVSNTTSSSFNLKSLDLSFNRVSTILQSTFKNFYSLEVLGLKNATIFFISRGSFINLTKLRVLNLESNPFKPFNQFVIPIFDGLINLESLFLGNCGILYFQNTSIFRHLKKLRYLDLRGNDLLRLDHLLIMPLVSLVGIDLSENRLQPWTSPLFINNFELKIVIVSSNRLNTITAAMMEDFKNLTRVDISHNAYFCDCWAFNQTMTWLLEHGLGANETCIANPQLVCSAPEEWRDQQVASFLDTSQRCIRTPAKFVFSTPAYILMAVVALLSICFGSFAYFYRWHIRYWVFLTRMAFLRRHGWVLKRNKVHPCDYKYDVFVSYSHEDRNFIVRLVAMLENQAPFLKLCVYERDFEIGTVISDTVMEKVNMSRRTLLVVSNAFAKSQWCMWELQLAEFHRLFLRDALKEGLVNDPLVIIKLGHISPSHMTPTLKFLLKSRIYLEWNSQEKKEAAFWDKLRATLTPEEKKALLLTKKCSLEA